MSKSKTKKLTAKMPSIRNLAEAYIYLPYWKQQVMLAGVA